MYLEISGIKRAAAPKRIYVGTKNTATPERRAAASQKGLLMREQMLRRYEAEIRKRALMGRLSQPTQAEADSKGIPMSKQRKRGRSHDRASVAGGHRHKTSHEAKKTGTTAAAVRSAVQNAGNCRDEV